MSADDPTAIWCGTCRQRRTCIALALLPEVNE